MSPVRTRSSRQLRSARRAATNLPQPRSAKNVYSIPSSSEVSEEEFEGDVDDNNDSKFMAEPAHPRGHTSATLLGRLKSPGGADMETRTALANAHSKSSSGPPKTAEETTSQPNSPSLSENGAAPADALQDGNQPAPSQMAAATRTAHQVIADMFEADASPSYADESEGESSIFVLDVAGDEAEYAEDAVEEHSPTPSTNEPFTFFVVSNATEEAHQASLDGTELQKVLNRMGQYIWAGMGRDWESKLLERNVTNKSASSNDAASDAQEWLRWHRHDLKTMTGRDLALDTYKLWQLVMKMPAASDIRTHVAYLQSRLVSHQLNQLMLAIGQSVNGLISYPKNLENGQTEKHRKRDNKILQDIRQHNVPLLSLVLKMVFIRGSTMTQVDTEILAPSGRFLSSGLQMLLRIARWLQQLIERASHNPTKDNDKTGDEDDPAPHQMRLQQGRSGTYRCVRNFIEQVRKTMEEAEAKADEKDRQVAASERDRRIRKRLAESRLEEDEEIKAKQRRFEAKTGGMYQGLAKRTRLKQLQETRPILMAPARDSWKDLPPPPDIRPAEGLSSSKVYALENGGWFYVEDQTLLRELRRSRGSPRIEGVQGLLRYRRERSDIIKRLGQLKAMGRKAAEERGIDIPVYCL